MFSLFPTVSIFVFCKNINPRLYISILGDESRRNNELVFLELLKTCN